jgi:hypothetical protein
LMSKVQFLVLVGIFLSSRTAMATTQSPYWGFYSLGVNQRESETSELCNMKISFNSMPLLHLCGMVLQHKRNFIYCLTWKIILCVCSYIYIYLVSICLYRTNIYISMVETYTDQIIFVLIKWHCSSVCYRGVWNSVSKLKKLERSDPSLLTIQNKRGNWN